MLIKRITWIALVVLTFIFIVAVVIYHSGTRYYPTFTFDENRFRKAGYRENINANYVRFRNGSVKQDIHQIAAKEGISAIEELISLSLKITKSHLYYDTSSLLGRANTDLAKVYHQHDVDWLYKYGHANCIGYAYVFASIFNELNEFFKISDSVRVRIVYESPVTLMYGYINLKHTWNEIVIKNHKTEKKIHIDANAADYYLPWNVTKFVTLNF